VVFLSLPGKCQDNVLNQAMAASTYFPIFSPIILSVDAI
jgi:hypothetical protein